MSIDPSLGPPDLSGLLAAQRAAFADQPMPTRRQRIARLDRLHNAILDHWEALVQGVEEDFGTRDRAETEYGELYPSLDAIAYARRNLRRFMRPSRRHTPLLMQPMSVWVEYQPKGVVGILTPWNFPFLLSLPPLISALTAGNRAMVKMSEFTPESGQVMAEMIAKTFDPDEVTVVNGAADVAAAFSALPFDHLLFTGSTPVGRHVMRAAAENLTPVTLELGGKSPALIHRDFPISVAAQRLAFGKTFSAGQACIAPDYILCPGDKVAAFCTAFAQEVAIAYPTLAKNPEATQIIDNRQFDRLQDLLDDARSKGAQIQVINPGQEDLSETRHVPVTLLTNVTDEMRVMREEIFGPLLPIVPYDELDGAIDYINARPRPLALYYFDWDQARAEEVRDCTHSGNVGLNDTMSQVAIDDLPFGGIGPSGMGAYHGIEGFRTLSHAKAVVRKGRFDARRPFFRTPRNNRRFGLFNALARRRYARRKVRD